jgi:hypothetical protein
MVSNDQVRGEAVAVFGEWAMCRVEAAGVVEAIAHEPSRRFLAEVGVPLQGPFFELDADFLVRPKTFAEYAFERRVQPGEPGGVSLETLAAWGRQLLLGDSDSDAGELWLDPDTGAVRCFVTDWNDPPCLVNSGLAELVASVALVERQRFVDGVPLDDLQDDEDEDPYEVLEAIVEQLAELDPPAFECCDMGALWAGWLDDPIASGGLDWEWSPAAAEFLRARGIEPTEREPRREVSRY